MSNLARLDLIAVLNEAVLVKQKPILGICLGMELMAESSEEGGARGLGWLDGRAVRLDIPDDGRHKVPHMGWNRIEKKKSSRLLDGLEESAEFYFAHSYHLELDDPSDLLAETQYGIDFPSVIGKENILGVQFHPEKSHDAGARMLINFVEM